MCGNCAGGGCSNEQLLSAQVALKRKETRGYGVHAIATGSRATRCRADATRCEN